MKTYNLFPTQVWEIDYPIPDGMLDFALKIQKEEIEKKKNPIVISNRAGSWHSVSTLLHKYESFYEDFLQSFVLDITKHDFIPNFRVSACWFNINKKGSFNIPHVHGGNELSMVWYLKAPKNCGDLELENPFLSSRSNLSESYPEDYYEENNLFDFMNLPAVEGRCYIFPSDLRHSVQENKSDELRISFSANLKFFDYE